MCKLVSVQMFPKKHTCSSKIGINWINILGAGLLGLYCSAILSSHAFSVFVVDKSAKRLRMVTEFGGVPLHPSLVGPIESKANYVLECTGDPVAPEQVRTWENYIFDIEKFIFWFLNIEHVRDK
jgi:threonine dehydrogenase-like Zn-dependent dehydrogenase